jgi:hypothetical protein
MGRRQSIRLMYVNPWQVSGSYKPTP